MKSKNLPKISIITPSYNQAQYLEQTILSVINQKYDNLEYIIIDGGSTDNSVEIIRKYESIVTYWVSEKDTGQSDAINKGLLKATGDIVTWLNSDDFYEPNTLQKISKAFIENEDLAIVHGMANLFGSKIKSKIIGLKKNIAFYEYLPYMKFPQPSSFFSKNYINKITPLSNNFHFAMDFEMVVKTVLLNGKIIRLDDILSNYRIHETSKSNNNLFFLKEWTIIVCRIFNTFKNGEKYANELTKLKLIEKNDTQKYITSIELTDMQLEIIFLQHLNLHYHYQYNDYNIIKSEIISNYIKKNYHRFYHENNYLKYNLRLRLIPKFIYKFIKKR